MKAPEKHVNGYNWILPDKEWLEDQYWTQDKDAKQIRLELGLGGGTVRVWLEELGITVKSRQDVAIRRSERTQGKLNPNYNHTWNTKYGTRAKQKRDLINKGVPQICKWCGTSEKVELHHKDHDKRNGARKNLVFLCHNCHMVETWVWHLKRRKKANVSMSNKIIIIDFNV